MMKLYDAIRLINGQVIGEWFKEQFDRLFSSIRKTVISPRKNKGIGL